MPLNNGPVSLLRLLGAHFQEEDRQARKRVISSPLTVKILLLTVILHASIRVRNNTALYISVLWERQLLNSLTVRLRADSVLI